MKILLSGIIIFCFGIIVSAQKDPAAGKILDNFSQKALDAPAVRIDFTLTINDRIEQSSNTSDGFVIIKDDKYTLELPDNKIWFNGSFIWSLSPEVEEVTITLPDPDDKTFISSPSLLFTMYREGFKYRLLSESSTGSVIDLYPDKPGETDFSIIRLSIGKNNELQTAEYRRKDGIDLIVEVNKYELRKNYKSAYFEFDQKKYPDIEIIDMR